MLDNLQKEKLIKWREIILNIIKEKPSYQIKNKNETKKKKLLIPIFPPKTVKQKNFCFLIWQKIKKNILRILIIFIFLIIGFLVILGIGLYKYNWANKQIIKITNIIPYPAMIIKNKETNNYTNIKYSEFQENFQAIKLFFQKQKQNDPNFQILSNNILKENTLEMMTEDYFIFEELQKNKIIIKEEEINNKMQVIINQVGSVENFKKIIKNLYNWDLEKFKNKAIKQMILQEKIENLIAPKNLKVWLKEQNKKVIIYKLL